MLPLPLISMGSSPNPLRYTGALERGRPLSPLPFALTLEPLAARIWASPAIVGFKRDHRTNDVVSLYADDTLLYLGGTQGSLQAVMAPIDGLEVCQDFPQIGTKSVLMPLDPISCPLPECARSVELVSSFRYLGIQITTDPN